MRKKLQEVLTYVSMLRASRSLFLSENPSSLRAGKTFRKIFALLSINFFLFTSCGYQKEVDAGLDRSQALWYGFSGEGLVQAGGPGYLKNGDWMAPDMATRVVGITGFDTRSFVSVNTMGILELKESGTKLTGSWVKAELNFKDFSLGKVRRLDDKILQGVTRGPAAFFYFAPALNRISILPVPLLLKRPELRLLDWENPQETSILKILWTPDQGPARTMVATSYDLSTGAETSILPSEFLGISPNEVLEDRRDNLRALVRGRTLTLSRTDREAQVTFNLPGLPSGCAYTFMRILPEGITLSVEESGPKGTRASGLVYLRSTLTGRP